MSTETQQQAAADQTAPLPLFAAPDFDVMKVAEIKAWTEEHAAEIEAKGGLPEGFEKMKAAEKRAHLKSMFDALSSPDVTGLDPSDPVAKVMADAAALKDADAAEAALLSIADEAQFHYFRAGAILCEMQGKGWHPGFEDFYGYVEATFGFRVRKAQTLMQVFRAVTGKDLTWADIEPLGWGKMGALASVLEGLTDKAAAKKLLKKAAGLTHAGVVELAKSIAAKAKDESKTENSSNVKKLTFPVFEDQVALVETAVEKAQKEGNTEHKGRALELICTAFLNNGQVIVKGAAAPAESEGGLGLEGEIAAVAAEDEDGEGLERIFTAVDGSYPSLDFDIFPEGKDAKTALGYLIEFIAQTEPEEVEQEQFEALVFTYSAIGGDPADLDLEGEDSPTAVA